MLASGDHMKRHSAAVAVATLGLVAPSHAQTWTQILGPAPSDRHFHAMVFDQTHQRLLVFGGYTNPGPVADTWAWSAGSWTQLSPVQSPPSRFWHAMAFDPARGRAVMFGGQGALAPLDDTWEFDGFNWSQVQPSNRPLPRRGHGMVFDSARQRVVLFGGEADAGGSSFFNDTWEFDGITWTLRTTPSAPPARRGHCMSYDTTRHRTVLFGGWVGTAPVADTWEWDGTSWVAKFTLTYPPARENSSMAFDAVRQTSFLFGGIGAGWLGDTWEFNGTSWTQTASAMSPSPRMGHAMTYLPGMHRVVLFGGCNGPSIGGTYINGPLPLTATAATFGAGCGTPPMQLLPDVLGRPLLGQVASASVSNAPTLAAAMSIGWSNVSYGPFALPVTLAGIGMPGCDLWTSADLTSLGLTPQSPTTLRFAMPLPNVTSLLGASVYLQSYAFAPGVNPLEIVVSNAVAWTLGDI